MTEFPLEYAAVLARLTPEQQQTFLAALLNTDNEDSLFRELEQHPDLLRALLVGDPSDIDHDNPGGLAEILEELNRPVSSLQEIPHRIEQCRWALELVERRQDAALWAALNNEMANSLVQNPQGSRADNLEQAIAHYQMALKVYTQQAYPERWADIQNNLAIAHYNRIHGERAENFEEAITHFRQALEVYTRQAYPERWAAFQSDLANVYRERIRGERAENLEYAIANFQQALEVITQQADPDRWALTQNNLGLAFSERIRGVRADNLEQAIAHYAQALEVYTRQATPERWAMTQNNLANAYGDRIKGERADNLEQSIEHYAQALEVYTRQTYPEDWAMTQNNLAVAYNERIRGDRAENLELAIAHYQQALEVRNRQLYPEYWAMTLNNLATAYYDRIRGERAENLEKAITDYQLALEVRTQQADPDRWALTQNNLGLAFSERAQGAQADNLEQAIVYYVQALEVYTRQANPERWAMTQNNLAIVYGKRIHGERAENVEQSIAHYVQALEVYTRQAYPERWATTQLNLGAAYSKRIHSERAENLEQAKAHYQQALEVATLAQFPATFQAIQHNLANLYFHEAHWAEALSACREAISAERLLLAGAYTEAGRQAEVGKTSELHVRATYSLLKLGRPAEALVQLEQGKTRLLSKALALNELDVSGLPETQQQRLQALRWTIRALEAEMRLSPSTPARRDERELAEALRQARGELIAAIEVIRASHPDFMPEGLGLDDILALIPKEAALVAPLVTSQGCAVFVIPGGLASVSPEHVLWLDDFKDADLQALLMGQDGPVERGGWLRAYFNSIMNMKAWFDCIEATGSVLWACLMESVAERLAALQVQQVLLMPQGELGLLPLHAAWCESTGRRRYFLDDYTVTLMPSAYARHVGQDRLHDAQRQGRTLFAVVNPTEDLPFTPVEGEQLARLFGESSATILPGTKATAEAIKSADADYLHFACHGFYDWQDPLQSGLFLAHGERLTLAQIIGQLNLESTRLVTLSACETGITDIRQSPDEYLGLPAGFLLAGAPAVVSTLWAVNDLSTMLLMERFYQLHLLEGENIPVALRHAQIWLRDVTSGQLAERFADEEEALLAGSRLPIDAASEFFARFAAQDPEKRPFAHPYYWAAFTSSGA